MIDYDQAIPNTREAVCNPSGSPRYHPKRPTTVYIYRANMAVVLAALGAMPIVACADDAPPPAAPHEIVLKNIDPARVVYLEHTGPYWTVGPLFKQVREAMTEHNEIGPMFARYLADPTLVPAESLRTEVGFVAQGNWTPEPPLKTAQREGEQVVSIIVEGSYGTTTRAYALLHDWISRQGFEAVGPLIEWYPSPPRGASPGAHRTEIQIPVRRDSVAAVATSEPKFAAVFPRKTDDTSVTSGVGVDDSTATVSTEPLYPIKDLIDSSRFDRVAEQLIPADRPMSAGMQIWFGQVVFRINAVAKGIEQTYPGGSPQATALSEAIVQRYRQAPASSKVDPLAQAVVRVDTHSDPQSAQKRSIVRDLDNLLGQVALRTVEPQSALDRLCDLLQRTQDLTNTMGTVP